MLAFSPVWSGEDSKLPGCSKELSHGVFFELWNSKRVLMLGATLRATVFELFLPLLYYNHVLLVFLIVATPVI